MPEHRGAARNDDQPELADVDVFPDPDRGNQQLCLDAGRALVLCGVLVATITTAFDPADDAAAANTTRTRALLGFLLWILGVCLCLLALMPAAPWVVRAGAAVAATVRKCLYPPVN
ncbi:hypothetical protein BAE44_0018533 [Dichanthelium oligosanthes]|uniref:Uncharacterized protein n=1 Tax=Dichanthelium oligosanthes TaxID=888268 RepID=A0A1E5V5K9_9POAL|nr:hypothetical protein BAE44_0018533 [Dichanthelium oligosanthes]